MSENQFAVILTNEDVFIAGPGRGHQSYPMRDWKKNKEVVEFLEQAVGEAGGTLTRTADREIRLPNVDEEGWRDFPADVHTTTETITYSLGSITMLLAFLHAAFTSMKTWTELKGGRYINVKIGAKTIALREGDDLVAAVQKFADDMKNQK